MNNDNDTPKRSRFPWAVVLIVLLGVCAGVWYLARERNKVYEFRFHMPDGYVYYEDATYKGSSRNTTGPVERYEYSWRSTYTVTRTPKGYSVVTRPSRIRIRPKTPDSAITRAMMSAQVTYRTDLNGRLTGVSVPRDFLRAVAKAHKSFGSYKSSGVPSSTLERYYGRQTAYARHNWNEMVGQFVGRSVRIGDRWTTTRPIVLVGPTGSFPTTKCVAEAFTREGRESLRITARYVPDPETTRKAYEKRYSGTRGPSGPGIMKYEERTEGEMVVDPDGIRVQSLSAEGTECLREQISGSKPKSYGYDSQWQMTSVFHYPREKRTTPKSR